MRVLLVEDDALLRVALLDALEAEGIEVLGLANAEDALILLAAGQVPEVLVADIGLGQGLSGADLAAVARSRHPDVEVILISGLTQAERGLPRAHERFLPKPFTIPALLAAVREAAARPESIPFA